MVGLHTNVCVALLRYFHWAFHVFILPYSWPHNISPAPEFTNEGLLPQSAVDGKYYFFFKFLLVSLLFQIVFPKSITDDIRPRLRRYDFDLFRSIDRYGVIRRCRRSVLRSTRRPIPRLGYLETRCFDALESAGFVLQSLLPFSVPTSERSVR